MNTKKSNDLPFTSIQFASSEGECMAWFDASEVCVSLNAIEFDFLWFREEEMRGHVKFADVSQNELAVYVDFVGLLLMLDMIDQRNASLLSEDTLRAKKVLITNWIVNEIVPILPYMSAWLEKENLTELFACCCPECTST